MEVPLTIFEARYRVLFSTLLADARDIDQELVQQDSPFRGSRQFGMCFVNNQGGVADIGTILEIAGHQTLEDGQILVTTLGTQRFKVLRVTAQRPVILADCEILNEDDVDNTAEAASAMEEVTEQFKALWALSNKLRKVPADSPLPDIGDRGPRALSYWMSSLFGESPSAQQMLLQEGGTLKRLQVLSTMFEQHVQYLRAAVALDSIGGGGDSGSSENSEGSSSTRS